MRVALLLSGAFRDGKETFDNLNSNLLSKYNVDIFIANNFDETPEVSVEKLDEIYKPTGISVNPYSSDFQNVLKKSHYYNKHIETNPETIFRMWYSIKQANILKRLYEKQNNFRYDIVIKSRFDLDLIDDSFTLKKDNKCIYIPIGWDHRNGVNDLFAYGDSESMDYYCSLYDCIFPYLEEDGITLHPEGLLKHHLERSELSVMRTTIKMLLRGMKVYELDYRMK